MMLGHQPPIGATQLVISHVRREPEHRVRIPMARRQQHVLLPSGHRDPYAVLGLAPDVTDDELRRAYRRLVAEHHPDRMVAKGVPEELMGLASAKMASINTAYRDVTRARGTRPALTSTQST